MKKYLLIGISLFIVYAISLLFLELSLVRERSCREDNDTKPKVETNNTSEIISVLTNPRQGTRLLFSLNIPVNWRTTLEKREHIKQTFSTYNDNLAVFNFLSPYIPHPEDSGLLPRNHLGFYDVTQWQSQDGKGPFGQPQKIENRKEYFNFLVDLRKTREDTDFSAFKKLKLNERASGIELGTFRYLESADGIFSGFATIETGSHAFSYDPEVFIYMAGTVNNRTFYINGRFVLYDEFSKQIDNAFKSRDSEAQKKLITEALKSKLPEESEKQLTEIVEVISSIKTESVDFK